MRFITARNRRLRKNNPFTLSVHQGRRVVLLAGLWYQVFYQGERVTPWSLVPGPFPWGTQSGPRTGVSLRSGQGTPLPPKWTLGQDTTDRMWRGRYASCISRNRTFLLTKITFKATSLSHSLSVNECLGTYGFGSEYH